MGRFTDTTTGVTFSVADEKDDRYAGEGYKPADAGDKPKPKSSTRGSTTSKSDK